MGARVLHVVPVDDLIEHEECGDQCACGPHVEFYPQGQVIVHHALDGRHADDWTWAREKAHEVAAKDLGADLS